jgi:transposase
MVALWAEVQRLHTRVAELAATLREPVQAARNSRVPPSRTPQATRPPRPPQETRREASVGRTGGGRPLHPTPDQVIIAKAKVCPLVVTRSRTPGKRCRPSTPRANCHPSSPSSHGSSRMAGGVPAGMDPGPPCGASVQSLATYLRYPHALSDERLSALWAQVCGLAIRAGGLANLFQVGNGRLEQRVADILTRLRSRRLGREATRARVHGRQQGEWVGQHAEVCLHVIRPSRGQGVSHEGLGTQRPTIWVSDLYSAQKTHPAAHWPVCWAHPVRECQLAIDAGDAGFAPRLKRVLRRALALHTRRDTLAASTLYPSRCDLMRRVTRCLALQPPNPHGHRRQQRDAKLQEHVCLFLDEAGTPPTNHSSEQAIRLSTVFRHVTNGLRSEWGRDLFAAVRSVMNTGKRQGWSAFQALQRALSPVGSLFEPG